MSNDMTRAVYGSWCTTFVNGSHTAWSLPEIVGTVSKNREARNPVVSFGKDGNLYVSWAEYWSADPRVYDVVMHRSTDGGSSWQDKRSIIKNAIMYPYDQRSQVYGVKSDVLSGHPFSFLASSSSTYWTDEEMPLYAAFVDQGSVNGTPNIYFTASWDAGVTWTKPWRVNDNQNAAPATHPRLSRDPVTFMLALSFNDRRTECPQSIGWRNGGVSPSGKREVLNGGPHPAAEKVGMENDEARAGIAGWCITTAVQHISPLNAALGQNVRMTAVWNPALSAHRPYGSSSDVTTIGTFNGVYIIGGITYTASTSTFDYGAPYAKIPPATRDAAREVIENSQSVVVDEKFSNKRHLQQSTECTVM
jgi:hypothetical protein